MKQPVDMSVPTVTVENYAIQDSTIGIPSPIGQKSTASSRFCTRAGNVKLGIALVERSKTGSAYVPVKAGDDMSDDSSRTLSKTKQKKKSKRVDVQEILSNQSRNNMQKAIVDLTGLVQNKGLSNNELMFKKEIWLDKKEFFIKKLKPKYSPREEQICLEIDKTKMEVIKAD